MIRAVEHVPNCGEHMNTYEQIIPEMVWFRPDEGRLKQGWEPRTTAMMIGIVNWGSDLKKWELQPNKQDGSE